eukprot:6924132-Pyramimonas_sp.AAC.1
MPPPHQLRCSPHTFRGAMRSSTEGPSGNVRRPPPRPFRYTPQTVRGPIGRSTEDGAHTSIIHNCIWLGPSPG